MEEPECNQSTDDGNESKASISKEKKAQEAEYADTDNHDTDDVQGVGARPLDLLESRAAMVTYK
ncbi:hypothetical protein Dsui_2417 [Azospira oryzae PS]|uniref:Uncharacterized protein n=1 Tax=Azospira oryzae (strain ATCC BAA-33 / DSM 13638 / PS) TaxID=640081 RepID=G8QLY7_AZOOP|nr:hypothetical protein [Azospira oryzae]AEV26777.1 hypothetical protein Dsui_2417 [Azospira oryzae PS]